MEENIKTDINENNKKIDLEELKKKKLNFIDKLFIRIFLSSLLLLSMVVLENNFTKTLMTKELNFLSYAKLFNGVFDGFIPVSDVPVYNLNIYDNVLYESISKENEIHNYTINFVQPLSEGVVTKIYKSKDNKFDVYIKSIDGYSYIYKGLENIEVSIYSYVNLEKIIGTASFDDVLNCYKFKLIIEKDGECFSYYDPKKD